mmetsp:Transcript_21933/g.40063  ORF Transcript_21933/g.40063 Transcript_21933/m.40063 type:complete len:109 (+) Transcript_21933:194-520(+)
MRWVVTVEGVHLAEVKKQCVTGVTSLAIGQKTVPTHQTEALLMHQQVLAKVAVVEGVDVVVAVGRAKAGARPTPRMLVCATIPALMATSMATAMHPTEFMKREGFYIA